MTRGNTYIFMLFALLGCGGMSMNDSAESDGLAIAVFARGGTRYLEIRYVGPQPEKIGFSSAYGSAYVTNGRGKWSLRGIPIKEDGLKKALWDFQDFVVLRKGTAISFAIEGNLTGVIHVAVDGGYTRDVEVYAARAGIHIWSGHVFVSLD